MYSSYMIAAICSRHLVFALSMENVKREGLGIGWAYCCTVMPLNRWRMGDDALVDAEKCCLRAYAAANIFRYACTTPDASWRKKDGGTYCCCLLHSAALKRTLHFLRTLAAATARWPLHHLPPAYHPLLKKKKKKKFWLCVGENEKA